MSNSIFTIFYNLYFPGAKPKKIREKFDEAYEYILAEDYTEALPIIEELSKEVQSARLNYYAGMCYLNVPGGKALALAPLVSACEHLTTAPDNRDIFDNTAPIDALYLLGEAYRINNRLDDALNCFTRLLPMTDQSDHPTTARITNRIEQTKRAKLARTRPASLKLSDYPCINGRFPTFRPVAIADTSGMVYMSRLKFYDAPIEALLTDTCILANIAPDIKSDGDFYLAGAGDSGRILFFEQSSLFANGNLYESKKDSRGWGKALQLPEPVNSAYREASASLSADGKKLYFASNRPGGQGGFDIYCIDYPVTESSGKPANLGQTINTSANELFAFETTDGKKLFFASEGHESIGGYDIFVAERSSTGSWDLPKALPYPLNTTENEDFFFPMGDGSSGLMALDSESNGRTSIYQVSNFVVSNPEVIPESAPAMPVLPAEPIAQVPETDTLRIVPVYFSFGKANVEAAQYIALDTIAGYLAKYHIKQVEIIGYTDSFGSLEYNRLLSLRRAESVAKYLQKATPQCKFKSSGMGESSPIAINTTEGRRYNRRVIVRISDNLNGLLIIESDSVPKHLEIKPR